MVPVATEHVGCVNETVGATGVKGCVLITALVAEEMHPPELLAVTLYVPSDKPENIPVVLV
jgi:hypothetical protein